MNEVINLINQNHNKLMKVMRAAKLTTNAIQIFSILERGMVDRQKDLAAEIGISKATIGAELKNLESKGFIERIRGDLDARDINVKITNAGLVQYKLVLRDLDKKTAHIDTEALANELRALLRGLGNG